MFEHILLLRSAFDIIRNQYFNICSLQELSEKTHWQNILNFIKDTGICKKIQINKYCILNMYILICYYFLALNSLFVLVCHKAVNLTIHFTVPSEL